MSEFPTRQIVVVVPSHIYERLAARAHEDDEIVESFAALLLEEAVRFGTPGELQAVAHLAAEAADLLADRSVTAGVKTPRLVSSDTGPY